MRERLGQLVAAVSPPILSTFMARRLKRTGYFGDFHDWQVARGTSTGYQAGEILKKVRDALLQVKSGDAVYERDSVLFDEVQYAWPLLAGLLWIASRSGNCLNVLDFGGSLGSSYFQNRQFMSHLAQVQWSILEQEDFVRCGQSYFEDDVLKFFTSVEECVGMRSPDTLLLSSVLPYLESPYQVLDGLLSQKPAYVIIDRTPFLAGARDRLTVQKVPAEIYGGSYPAWFFSKSAFLQVMQRDYLLIAEFDALAGVIDLGDELAEDKGFIFVRRDRS